jgi:hypothetical protein
VVTPLDDDVGWRRRTEMGKGNRARRSAKKRWEHRRQGKDGGRAGNGRPSDGVGADLRYLLIATGRAIGSNGGERSNMDLLDLLFGVAADRGSVGTALVVDEVLRDCLERAWEGGWLPAELVRTVRRRLTERHADLVATAIAAHLATIDAPPPEPWTCQLQELGADETWWGRGRDWLGPWALRSGTTWLEALMSAVEVLGVVVWLRVIQTIIPPPSAWRFVPPRSPGRHGGVDDGTLAKVRALLAKAESTNFEHEAAALTAKAQELMSRHAIDEAMAQGASGESRETPRTRRLPVDDPYAGPKSTLLGVVAAANSVRCVWDDEYALMTLVGFEADLDAVDLVFTSLVVQASRAVLAKGTIRDERGRTRTRSFRQSFYIAFAQRIHERLQLAALQARESAERDLGRNVLPVLAGRKQEVDDVTEKMFPHLTGAKRSSVTNREGWQAGRTAAEMATLGPLLQRLAGTAG